MATKYRIEALREDRDSIDPLREVVREGYTRENMEMFFDFLCKNPSEGLIQLDFVVDNKVVVTKAFDWGDVKIVRPYRAINENRGASSIEIEYDPDPIREPDEDDEFEARYREDGFEKTYGDDEDFGKKYDDDEFELQYDDE